MKTILVHSQTSIKMKFILVMLIFSNEKAEKIYVKISITTDELSCFSLDIK